MTSETPGWDAIDGRLEQFYPGVEPQHFGTLIKFALGGPDPLDGISVYARDEPVPHWHLVSYGMSELYGKENDNPEESGWGFEFTMRVAREAADLEAPMWALNLLQNLARYVFSSGNWIAPGDHMDAGGPICGDHPTDLVALAFAADPELGVIGTPHGRVQFLQVVGLTAAEYEAARQWRTTGVLDLLAARLPLLVTDLDRASITDDPGVRAAIEAGREQDGSATGLLMVAGFGWTADGGSYRLSFAAATTRGVADGIRDRLPHGSDLILVGTDTRTVLKNADTFAVERKGENELEIRLPAAAVTALQAALVPGTRVVPGTTVVIEVG